MNKIITKLEESAKAIVALAAPIVTATVTEVLGELSIIAQGLVTAGVSALSVWWVKNRPSTGT